MTGPCNMLERMNSLVRTFRFLQFILLWHKVLEIFCIKSQSTWRALALLCSCCQAALRHLFFHLFIYRSMDTSHKAMQKFAFADEVEYKLPYDTKLEKKDKVFRLDLLNFSNYFVFLYRWCRMTWFRPEVLGRLLIDIFDVCQNDRNESLCYKFAHDINL